MSRGLRVLVAGAGAFGTAIALELARGGAEVVLAEGGMGQRLALIGGRPVELFDTASLLAAGPTPVEAEG